MKQQNNCLFPKCDKRAICRGLCGAHYGRARYLVASKIVDWETLAKNGKCSGGNLGVGGRTRDSWFLEKK